MFICFDLKSFHVHFEFSCTLSSLLRYGESSFPDEFCAISSNCSAVTSNSLDFNLPSLNSFVTSSGLHSLYL